MTTQEQAAENTAPAEPTPSPELTISDLNNIRQIVEAAVRRGAFQAGELTSVGTAYDKLSSFLQAVAAQQKPEAK